MKRREFLGAIAAGALAGCAQPPAVPRPPTLTGQPGEPWPSSPDRAAGGGVTNMVAAVPYVPTRPEVVGAMIALAEVGSRDMVYDLGCGDGRLVIAAARDRGARGLGVDIVPELIDQATAQAQYARVTDRVSFMLGDLFALDLKPATVVMLYLSVELNVKLIPKLKGELRPGSRIVSNRFDMGDVWAPARSVTVARTPLHLWRV